MALDPELVWYVAYLVLLGAVAVERLAELVVTKRNAAWSFARGGVEFGRGHYPLLVSVHVLLLLGCAVEAWFRPFVPALGWSMFMLVLAAQGLRWWCIAALGRRWNTRVIVVPSLPLVSSGPYRFLKHPNYVAIVLEGIALPLVHSAWLTATLFTVANAALLTVRIRAENRALRQCSTSSS